MWMPEASHNKFVYVNERNEDFMQRIDFFPYSVSFHLPNSMILFSHQV